MRYLFLALLLLSWGAHAATISPSVDYCSNTGRYVLSGGCPCNISAVTPGPIENTSDADVTVVLTQEGSTDNCAGTIHVGLDVEADAPTRDEVIANTGLIDKQTAASTGAGTYVFNGASVLSGAAETMYKVTAELVPSGNHQNRITWDSRTSDSFTTNATPGGGGGGDISGLGLFVAANDGGNSDETTTGSTGTSSPAGCTQHFNSPCGDLDEPSPAVSQDIYLAEGSVFNDDDLVISQSGESGDPVVISCYYNNGGTANQCSSF